MTSFSLLKDQYLFVRVFEQAPIGMALLTPDASFRANSSLCNMLGYSESELKEIRVESITHPDDLEVDLELWRKLVKGEIESYQIEKRYLHKSGEVKWGILNVSVERDQHGNRDRDVFISQIVDITEQKIKEEKIRDAEKLSLVGELAAGIAHEIRNPLTSLRGFVQMYQKEDVDGKYALRNDVMLKEIDRINEIVSELLVLAKPGNETYQLSSITEKLDHVVTLFEGQANLFNIIIKKEWESDLLPIYCHDSLKQVFINVLKNAFESMPLGGEVRIVAKKKGEQIHIYFIDQGTGIPPHELQRIFHPFYTTKESGTGLGLMISQQIIQNHKGKIRIKSESGQGTIVEIMLPVGPIASSYL